MLTYVEYRLKVLSSKTKDLIYVFKEVFHMLGKTSYNSVDQEMMILQYQDRN